MEETLVSLFHRTKADAARGKYLSRIFGIFSEELVRIWCLDSRAPYENLGRPRLWYGENGWTLDFLFRCRRSGNLYVVEQKCEIEYQNYRYFVLSETGQLKHHESKAAFQAFLSVAKGKSNIRVTCAKRPVNISGAILIWGEIDSQKIPIVLQETGLFDVLALSVIISDLGNWGSSDYLNLIESRRAWVEELFDFLAGSHLSSETGRAK